MSSNLLKESQNLNKGIFDTFTICGTQDLYKRKFLELIGAVPINTICYVCGDDAIHDYNNYKLCVHCYNKLNDAISHRETHTCKDLKLFYCGEGEWMPETTIGSNYIFNRKENKFISSDLEEMLKITLLPDNSCYESTTLCFNCNTYKYNRMFCYENKEVCWICRKLALNYFYLPPNFYLHLKIIFNINTDIAKYIISLYFKLKLRR